VKLLRYLALTLMGLALTFSSQAVIKSVGGGSGGGASLSVANNWSAVQTFTVGATIDAPSGNNAVGIATGAYTFGNATDNPTYTFAGSGLLAASGISLNPGASATNVAIGVGSMAAAVTGTDNAAFGAGALAANTSGANNTAVGWDALTLDVGGHLNTAIGTAALGSNVSGNSDTAVGYNAGFHATGNGNTLVGYNSGVSITSSVDNLVIGSENTGGTVLATGSGGNVLIGAGNSTCLFTSSSQTATITFCGSNGAIWSVTGTGTPATAAESFTGSIAFPNVTTGTNTYFVCMATANVLTLQTSACTISSKRFKEHLIDMRSSALPAIGGMEVASFNMKPAAKPNPDPNYGSRQIGLIAENIAKVAPECAIYENDMKTPKSYRQECVIALLVKSVQEQQREIRALKARVH
jgi:hypothetical protein